VHPSVREQVREDLTQQVVVPEDDEFRGAAGVVAFDVDLDAVVEARRNLFRNSAIGAVRLVAGPLASIGGAFDLILANMIWEEVEPLVAGLASRLAPGGTAVFSGILDEREAAARAGLTAAGFRIANVESDGEWRTIVTTNARNLHLT